MRGSGGDLRPVEQKWKLTDRATNLFFSSDVFLGALFFSLLYRVNCVPIIVTETLIFFNHKPSRIQYFFPARE